MYIIAGKYYKQKLQAPVGDGTRPTASRLRETLFNILQEDVQGSDFLDIFAGTGAIGIEALSRGAKTSTFIENDRAAYQALNQNLKQIKATSEAKALFGDYIKSLQALGKRNEKFHIIFADAPYHMEEAVRSILEQVVSNNLLNKQGRLFIENASKLPEGIDLHGLTLVNSRKSGKAYLHQFERVV